MKDLTKKELEKLIPKIELVPINDIRLNPNNPRTITERKFNDLVKSVTSFWSMLFLRPVILDDDFMVLGGNMRTLAGRKAGFSFLPCIKASNLSDQQRAEFIVKDNLPFGDWNFDQLANAWDQELLSDWGLSFSWSGDQRTIDEPGPARTRSSSYERVESFGILVSSDTELERQRKIGVLEKAGLIQDKDFQII